MAIETVKYTKDDWDFPMVLEINGRHRTDLAGSTIKAAIVDNKGTVIIAAVEVTEDAGWATADIAPIFPRATTDIAKIGQLYVEVQVEIAALRKTHGRMPFTVVTGGID